MLVPPAVPAFHSGLQRLLMNFVGHHNLLYPNDFQFNWLNCLSVIVTQANKNTKVEQAFCLSKIRANRENN
jgi:hypothetical protein